jgi:hypothetical protein
MVILNGSPGIGKTSHAKEYCSYITKKEENKIVRWIDSDSETNIKQEIKKIIKAIKNRGLGKINMFDEICNEFAYIVISVFKQENLLFVFDNLEDFELIEIFYRKFENVNNVQMLITT